MINKINFYKYFFVLVGLAILFLLPRLLLIDAPYHQDEYKWPMYANPSLVAPGMVPHPPLTELIYRYTRVLFGDGYFRLTPMFFGLANLLILFFLANRRYGLVAAKWASLFFCISFFSILASITVDTDGSILPFFFLSSLWFYDSFRLSSSGDNKRFIWLFLMGLIMFLGFMIKLSFILAIGAVVADYLISERQKFNRQTIKYLILIFLGSICAVALFLYLSKFIFPGFSFDRGLKYWLTFLRGFSDRNFFQTLIQLIKSLMYLSPVLVLAGLVAIKKHFVELRVFYLFILFGLTFYLVLFDFSIGALDRYMAFLVIPLCIVLGFLMASYFRKVLPVFSLWPIGSALILGLGVFFVQYIPHTIFPMYPKNAWVDHMILGPWNFLFPFSGGSGPLPFYVSWLFILLVWGLSLVLACLYFYRNDFLRKMSILAILILSLIYNITFTEELIFGKINGSARVLVYKAKEFINSNPNIKKVIVYNDNGAYEIKETGKYDRRLYAVPGFEETYKKVFSQFDGHILAIEIPKIYSPSLYSEYLASCKTVYQETSGQISSRIYSCKPQKYNDK